MGLALSVKAFRDLGKVLAFSLARKKHAWKVLERLQETLRRSEEEVS